LAHSVTPTVGYVHTDFGFCLFVFELGARTGEREGQTNRRTYNAAYFYGRKTVSPHTYKSHCVQYVE